MLLPRTGVRLKAVYHATARGSFRVAERRTVSYSSKVTALPFVLTPEDAKKKVSFIAAATSFSSFGRIFSSLLSSLGFGGDVLQPKRIQAVYLPAWFIDGLGSAKVHITGNQKPQFTDDVHAFRAFSMNLSYMPGFSLEPMSRMGFGDLVKSPTFLYKAIPLAEALTKQDGMDIELVPYTSTPFALEDAMRNLPAKPLTITEGFTFDPNTVVLEVQAAYPVLIPVYLIQYDATPFGQPEWSFTLLVEAARKDGHIFVENTLRDAQDFARQYFNSGSLFDLPDELAAPDFFKLPPSVKDDDAHFALASPCLPFYREKLEQVTAWVDDKVSQPGVMKQYEDLQRSLKQSLDMDHNLLVRPATEIFDGILNRIQETQYRLDWLRFMLVTAHKNEDDPNFAQFAVFPQTREGRIKTSAEMRKYLHTERKRLDEEKPEWKKQWEAQQTSEYATRRQKRFPWLAGRQQ